MPATGIKGAEGAGPAPLLRVTAVSKAYGSNRVLDDVSLDLAAGESLALLGENGAGKSTLAKVIAGVVRPSSGALALAGRPFAPKLPRDALAAGVGFIPQELTYVPHLTAAENLVMGSWPGSRGTTSLGRSRRHAQDAVERFGFSLDTGRRMEELNVAERQVVEIVKALVREVQVLVLDEPTAALSDSDSELLFGALHRLQKTGVAILTVLHRLDQVESIADRAQVLRNGRQVLAVDREAFDRREIVRAMLGAKARAAEQGVEERAGHVAGPPVLSISGLSHPEEPVLRSVDLTVGSGEVLAIFGVKGAGGEQFGPILGGVRRPSSGRIEIGGRSFRGFSSPGKAWRAGIGYLPRERKREGLVLDRSIVDNIWLTRPAGSDRAGILRGRTARSIAEEMIERLQIVATSPNQPVGELSGGNQQKVLLAARLAADPKVLVLDHPTRGVDIGARVQIHSELRSLADDGLGLLMISSDVEEASVLADRMLIIRSGKIVGELAGADLSQSEALQIASAG